MSDSITSYLEGMVKMRREHFTTPEGFEYLCMEDYVLRNGTVMRSEALTAEEAALVREALDRAQRAGADVHEFKQCFANAQSLVMFADMEELTYHEGYACGRVTGFPIHHGWVAINGKVVDLTWELECPVQSRDLLPNRPVGKLPEGYVYIGFPVENVEYIRQRIFAREMIGSLLDDWEANYPLLRGTDPDDEASWEWLDE